MESLRLKQRRSYDEEIDVTELIGFAEQEIFRVSEGNVKRSVQSAADILRKALAQIEEASKTAGEYNGVRSGFTDIDSVTLGWQPSDLIIIAAPSAIPTRRHSFSNDKNYINIVLGKRQEIFLNFLYF